MSDYVSQLLQLLKQHSVRRNPSIHESYPTEEALTIWTEGGEWPAYDVGYKSFANVLPCRNSVDVEFDQAGSITDALMLINKKVSQGDICGLSMECGLGKSTKLVQGIHRLKLGMRTIVAQPSSVTAYKLVEYINSPESKFINSSDELVSTRAIYYMSVGLLLDLLAKCLITEDDIVILDEAHTTNFTYRITLELLCRIESPLIMMTASTTPYITERQGVRNIAVEYITPELSEEIATNDNMIIVGVLDNMAYAAPANIITGNTFPGLTAVYDTGLRPNPRVTNTNVLLGERKANIGEIIQTLGRLGRTEGLGRAYFNEEAISMKRQPGFALYTVLSTVISTVLGLESGDVEGAISLWKKGGIMKSKATRSVASDVSDSLSKDNLRKLDTVNDARKRVNQHSSSKKDNNDKRWDVHTTRSTSYESEGSRQVRQTLDKAGNSDNPNNIVAMDFSRIKRKGTNSILEMTSGVSDITGSVNCVLDKKAWTTLLKQGGELPLPNTTLRGSAVKTYWIAIVKSMHYGDTIYPCVIPLIDKRQVTLQSEEEARMIISDKIIPSFTEQEIMSVISVWNKYVISLHGKCASYSRLSKYVNYFDEAYGFGKALLR